MTGGVLVLINQAAQCSVGTEHPQVGCWARLPAEGDRGGCGVGVHNLAASTLCAAQPSTAHVPVVVILILESGASQSKEHCGAQCCDSCQSA